MKKDKTIEDKTIDANGITLGRVASIVATNLMGKTKASYQRNVPSGVSVKVINASKIKITTKKLEELYHTKYSGYPGGLKIIKGVETREKKGMKELVKLAVYRMLPSNKLRKQMLKNLTIYD